MATKSHTRSFGNRFLNFIGVVDQDPDSTYDQDYAQQPRGRKRAASGPVDDDFGEDPFDEQPPLRGQPARQSAGSSRQGGPSSRQSGAAHRQSGASSRQSAGSARQGGSARYDEAQDWRRDSRDEYAEPSRGASRRPATSGNYRPQEDEYRPADAGARNRDAQYAGRAERPQGAYDYGASRARYSQQPAYDAQRQPRSAPEQQRGAARPGPAAGAHQTIIFKVRSVDECKAVILALIEKKSVLINMEQADATVAQRVLDMLCGAAYAISATPSKVNDATWLITPNNVVVNEGIDVADMPYSARRFL